MLRNLIFSLLAIALFQCTSTAQNNISTDEFEKGIKKENIQVLDVRTQEEYNSGHIKNSFLADWTKPEQFKERIKSLDKSKPVYTYCLSGGRSSAAAAYLKEAGFSVVYNLAGGITGWKKASKEIEGVEKAKQITMEEYLSQVKSDKIVLVDIGAVWCPPCKKMEPVLKDLVLTHGNNFKFLQIDGGVQESIVKELNAASFPTFIIYKNGKEVWRKEGIVTKEELLNNL